MFGVTDCVNVLVGSLVLVGVGVDVGARVSVGANVAVGCCVKLGVAVGKLGTMVMPGVRVGVFGTQSNCPAKIVVDDPMQLARWSCGYVMP